MQLPASLPPATTMSSSASASMHSSRRHAEQVLAQLDRQRDQLPPPPPSSITEANIRAMLAQQAALAPGRPLQYNRPDFSGLHPDIPFSLLKTYERNFLNDNPNMSSEAAPHPDDLVRPPPSPVNYWVVTAGEKIGLCHYPSEIDLSHIFLLPSFSVTRFESWDEAVKFYRKHFKTKSLGLSTFTDLGTPNEPIPIESTTTTPVPVGKKTRFMLSKPSTAPGCSLGAKTRVHKNRPDAGSEGKLHGPSTPWRPAIEVSSESDDTITPAKASPEIVVDDNSDDDASYYPKALLNYNTTPALTRKRAAQDQDGRQDSILAERGSPIPKFNRPLKKARATSEPAKAHSPSPSSDDWAAQPLMPLVFTTSKASTSAVQHSRSVDNAEIVDNGKIVDNGDVSDQDLPPYIFPSTQPSLKGKGKAKEVV